MQAIYVPLAAETKERLRRLALLERRDPRMQAAVLLERALEDRSLSLDHAPLEPVTAS